MAKQILFKEDARKKLKAGVDKLTNTVKVTLAANTTIEKLAPGAAGDIAVGNTVTVGGQRIADGSVQAATVLVNQVPAR